MAKGNRGGKVANGVISTYDSIPYAFRVNSSYATKEEKAMRKQVLDKFMSEAEVGNVYRSGNSLGSAGSEFEIVYYNRSKNKMGLKWSGSNSRPVQLDRGNAEKFIFNGAKLIKRAK